MIPDSPTCSESSMDSALEVSHSESSKSIPPNLRFKGVKLDSGLGKPPIVSTRASSTGFILKRRSKSAQDDQLILMSPSKRKRYGRETKSRSLNDLVDPHVPNVTSSECTLEGPTTTIFYDCPIEPDNEIKHVENEPEASHLAKLGRRLLIRIPMKTP